MNAEEYQQLKQLFEDMGEAQGELLDSIRTELREIRKELGQVKRNTSTPEPGA